MLSCLLSILYSVFIFSCISSSGTSAVKKQKKQTQAGYPIRVSYAVELTYSNFTTNYKDWDTDMAIMFYVPWCKYCKQLSTSWEQIAAATSTTNDLVVGKFNCEKPAENAEICVQLGVDRYPSVYFMGYGDLHQAPKGNPFAKNIHPRIAQYNADLYPEAIYDWIRMLAQISTSQRYWDDFKAIFTGRSRSSKKVEALKIKVNY